MKISNARTRFLTRAGIIAALYAATTLFLAPISYGAVQCRVSEALTLLPMLTPAAIPGLFIGCLVANLLGSGVWYDVVFGSLTTLIAALLTRRLKDRPLLASLPPVILNGVIVGGVIYFAYEYTPGAPVQPAQLLLTMGSVALGEAVACCVLGVLLMKALKKLPGKILG